MRVLALTLLLAAPATAQQIDPSPWRAEFQACTKDASTTELQACRGKIAERCSDETEGGWSNLGMTACIRVEGQLWDELLNEEWGMVTIWAENGDISEAEFFGEQFSGRSKALLSAQRAWIAFRDAECELQYARWGSGSMRHPSHAACVSDMTAERVIALVSLMEEF